MSANANGNLIDECFFASKDSYFSLNFGGVDYYTLPYFAGFLVNFYFEFKVKFSDFSATQHLFGFSSSASETIFLVSITNPSASRLLVSFDDDDSLYGGSFQVEQALFPVDKWHTIAVQKTNTTFRLWLNSELQGVFTDNPLATYSGYDELLMGAAYPTHIDGKLLSGTKIKDLKYFWSFPSPNSVDFSAYQDAEKSSLIVNGSVVAVIETPDGDITAALGEEATASIPPV